MTAPRLRALEWIAAHADRLRARPWRFHPAGALPMIRCATPDGSVCPMSAVHADLTPGASPLSDTIERLAAVFGGFGIIGQGRAENGRDFVESGENRPVEMTGEGTDT